MGTVIFSTVVIVVLELAVAAAVGVCLWSVVRSLRKGDRGQAVVNGIPVALISRSVAVGLVALLALTFVLGSSSPILINGLPYESVAWLKLSDMFVVSIYVMLLLAVTAVVAGRVWSRRLRDKGAKTKTITKTITKTKKLNQRKQNVNDNYNGNEK